MLTVSPHKVRSSASEEQTEFHTFVHAGPIFSAPIACHVGEIAEREGFVFCDVVAADA